MTANVELHVFAANDLNGDPIHVFTDEDDYFRSFEMRMALAELGSGQFTLQRRVGFALLGSGIVGAENFIRVLIPAISPTEYVWGFFLDNRHEDLLSTNEEAGEFLTFGGPGPKYYLSRAQLWDENYVGSAATIDIANRVRRWRETATAGKVWITLIEDDAANSQAVFLPDITRSFDAADDSDNDAWDGPIADDEEFELPLGVNYLELDGIINAAADTESTMYIGSTSAPVMRLDVWQAYGEDRTPANVDDFSADVLNFREGVNILTDLARDGQSHKKPTHAMIFGKDNAVAHKERPTFTPGDYAKAITYELSRTRNTTILERFGLRQMRMADNADNEFEFAIAPGFTPTDGLYMYGPPATTDGHFKVGDYAGLTTGGAASWGVFDYRNDTQRIMACRMVFGPEDAAADPDDPAESDGDHLARSWAIVVEFNVDAGSQSAGGGGGGGDGLNGGDGSDKCCTKRHNHHPPFCEAQPEDTVLIDWDWGAACDEVPWTDSMDSVAYDNAWNDYLTQGWTGSPGCSTGARRAESRHFAVTEGDVLTMHLWCARYGGAGGATDPATFQIRWYNSGGTLIATQELFHGIQMGGLSHNGGDHGEYVENVITFDAAPAGAAHAGLKQTEWSTFFVERVTVTVAADPVDNDAYCVPEGSYDPDDPYDAPSTHNHDDDYAPVEHTHTPTSIYTTWKAPVRVATTANGTLASAFDEGSTVDGVVLAASDRILIKDQTDASENGIYLVQSSGAPVRDYDMDDTGDPIAGAMVRVNEGTTNADTVWGVTTNDPIDLDTDDIVWEEMTGGGGGGGHDITEDGGSPFATRGNLDFRHGLDVSDDSGSDSTRVAVDESELTHNSLGGLTTGDPHTQYALDSDLSSHAAAADPHTGYLLESLGDNKGDLIGFSADNTPAKIAAGSEGQIPVQRSAATPGVAFEYQYASLQVVMGDGVNAIASGAKLYVRVPYACTIVRATLMADVSGAIKVDIWKDTYTNFPPTDADTITGGNEPEIAASGVKDEDTTLTSWTTALAEGDILGFNVDSATSVKRVTLELRVRKS